MNTKLGKILVVKMSALGDVVWTVPMVRQLRELPGVKKVTWLIDEGLYPLVEGLEKEGIDFIKATKPQSFQDYRKLRQRINELEFDTLIAAQASWRLNILYPFLKIKRKIGFGKRKARDFQSLFMTETIRDRECHEADGLLDFVEHVGGVIERPLFSLPVDHRDQLWCENLFHSLDSDLKWVGVVAIAGHIDRSYCGKDMVDLIHSLLERPKVGVMLLGAPSDPIYFPEAHQIQGKRFVNMMGRTSLGQLKALVKKFSLFISPDTGAIHVADAQGTPSIGLYAVVPPQFSGPYRAQGLCVNKYPEALKKFTGKKSEEVALGQRIHSSEAIKLIRPLDVLKVIDEYAAKWEI